jgi:hypothetical protein
MNRVHLGPCEAYDVSGKCQNFLDSFLICESYFWTEVVPTKMLLAIEIPINSTCILC